MDLVILILMLIYVFFRVSNEKYYEKTSKREYAQHRKAVDEAFDAFVQTYTDEELEKQVQDDKELRQRIKEKILRETELTGTTDEIITMVAMAEYGKVPKFMTMKCISVQSNASEVSQERIRAFAIWYNDIMRSHGMEEDLRLTYVDMKCKTQEDDIHGKIYKFFGADFWWPSVRGKYLSPWGRIYPRCW